MEIWENEIMKCPHCGAEFETLAEIKNRERQRRWKANHKGNVTHKTAGNVTQTKAKQAVTSGNVTKVNGFKPPTYKEVRGYCDERDNQVDPIKFCDFYESKGWMVGKTKMKSWKAAVRTWEKQ